MYFITRTHKVTKAVEYLEVDGQGWYYWGDKKIATPFTTKVTISVVNALNSVVNSSYIYGKEKEI